MTTRRVVTGFNAAGQSIVVSDERVEGGRHHNLGGVGVWGSDNIPQVPNDGAVPVVGPLFPEPQGCRFSIMTIYPDGAGAEAATGSGAQQRQVAQLESVLDEDRPGMHATTTVDLIAVIAGEASMELGDGSVVHLQRGDTLVQNGTRHRWFNRGTEPAQLAVFMVGATTASH